MTEQDSTPINRQVMADGGITTCPHCDEKFGTREEFKNHVEAGHEPPSRWERASKVFDGLVFPVIVGILGLVESFVFGNASLGLALILIASLWIKQNHD